MARAPPGQEICVDAHSPVSLLVHDGELSDVCALMARLELLFTDRRGPPRTGDQARPWDLLISTPKRMLEFEVGASGSVPVRMAVMEEDSKTLRAMLQRAGVDLIVRRPVHPEALRMLVLHSLYRGPEKRRSLRVSIGTRVHYRAGLRRRPALLTDLSLTGCRLLAALPLERGRRLTLFLPGDIAGGRGFALTGRVVRGEATERPGTKAVGITFEDNSKRIEKRLCGVVARHSAGPATLASVDAEAGLGAGETRAREEMVGPTDLPDRRSAPRHRYAEHVIALGDEAARVLIGRDISLGGMRTDPHPDVSVGDELRIALHVRPGQDPLVVKARVERDDGEDGLVLQFIRLQESARHHLERMANFLPILAVRKDGGDGEEVVVSEILDRDDPEAA